MAVQRNKINLLVYEPSQEAILQWITHACYADILKQTLQEATRAQPCLRAIELYPVCDVGLGHFLILPTGWDKQRWIDTILFHARLIDNKIVIEEDNFEEGLSQALIEAGIKAEYIVTSSSPENSYRHRAYQTV